MEKASKIGKKKSEDPLEGLFLSEGEHRANEGPFKYPAEPQPLESADDTGEEDNKEEGGDEIAETASEKKEYMGSGEILTGAGAEDLKAAMCAFEMANGDKVIAGTDKGVNYGDHNDDRVVVDTANNFIAVVDGVGGYIKGERAAQILAEHLLTSPQDIAAAVSEAIAQMEQEKLKENGAVFISAKLNVLPEGKFLDISQRGDSRLIIIKKNGKVGFKSKDESRVQGLVDKGTITPDEALYSPLRNEVTAAVSEKDKGSIPTNYPPEKVEDGDLVLVMSDGISDNFTPEEIALKREGGMSPEELYAWLSDKTGRRMRDYKKIIKDTPDREKVEKYSDGFKSKPKPDNRALVIWEIGGKKEQAVENIEGPAAEPEQAIPVAVEKTKKELIEDLENIIIQATKRLAEIEIELASLPDEDEEGVEVKKDEVAAPLASEKLMGSLAVLEDKLANKFMGGLLSFGLKKDVSILKEKIAASKEKEKAIEKDRKENPFKYYLMDRICPANLKVMGVMGIEGEDGMSLDRINTAIGKNGKELKFKKPTEILKSRNNAVNFSSNGFYISIKNPNEVRVRGEIYTNDEKARYDVIGPDGSLLNKDINGVNYKESRELLVEKASEYQLQKLQEFKINI